MRAFPSQVGTLSGIGTLPASSAITPVRFDVVNGVGFVKRMAVFAVRLTRHVMRAVFDAVALVFRVVAQSQVYCRVVGGIAVKVSDLHSLGVADKCEADKAVDKFPGVHHAVAPEVHGVVALRGYDRGKNASAMCVLPSAVPHLAVQGTNAPLVADLVERESEYRSPSLHVATVTFWGEGRFL